MYTTLFWHISNQIFELANYQQLRIHVYHCRKLPKKRIVENALKVLRNSLLKRKMSKNLQLHVQPQDYLFFSCTSCFLRKWESFRDEKKASSSSFRTDFCQKLVANWLSDFLITRHLEETCSKSFHKPLWHTFLLKNWWWGILNLIFGIRKRRIEYIFNPKKVYIFWHLELFLRISHNLRRFSSNLFSGHFLKRLTCILSCSELTFLQKLVTYVEKKGGIQKFFLTLYQEN